MAINVTNEIFTVYKRHIITLINKEYLVIFNSYKPKYDNVQCIYLLGFMHCCVDNDCCVTVRK